MEDHDAHEPLCLKVVRARMMLMWKNVRLPSGRISRGGAQPITCRVGVNWRAAMAECTTPVVIALMSATPINMLLITDAVMRKLTACITPPPYQRAH